MIGNVHVNPGVLAGMDATVGIRATVDHWICTVHVRGGDSLVTRKDAICYLLGGGEGESDGKGRKSSILMRCGLEMERMRNKMVDQTETKQKIK